MKSQDKKRTTKKKSKADPESAVNFFAEAGLLKKIKRSGWWVAGIKDPESVADHSFGVAMLAMLLGIRTGRDVGRCVIMALVHDMGEAVIGDITPSDGVPASQKDNLERAAAQKIFADVDDDGLLLGLWEEYTAGSSQDARFIKELDKLEMALQADQYEKARGNSLDDFFTYAGERIDSDEVGAIFTSLMENRREESP